MGGGKEERRKGRREGRKEAMREGGREEGRKEREKREGNLYIWLLCMRRITHLWVTCNVYLSEGGSIKDIIHNHRT